MNKKNKKIIMFLSALLMITLINLKYGNKSFAKGSDIKLSLLAGIKAIDSETLQLRESKVERYLKLENDLKEFKEKGSSKISSDNMFYLLKNNNFSAKELDNALKDTGLKGLGADFKAAEDTYGVNAILLMAMARHETGNGTSELFQNKNNLFGFNAVDHDPYNKATDFNTPADSINAVAKHLKENYLNANGDYYNGISTDGIGISYATDPDRAAKVDRMMTDIAESMIQTFYAGE